MAGRAEALPSAASGSSAVVTATSRARSGTSRFDPERRSAPLKGSTCFATGAWRQRGVPPSSPCTSGGARGALLLASARCRAEELAPARILEQGLAGRLGFRVAGEDTLHQVPGVGGKRGAEIQDARSATTAAKRCSFEAARGARYPPQLRPNSTTWSGATSGRRSRKLSAGVTTAS
jgi:hypothetical protein